MSKLDFKLIFFFSVVFLTGAVFFSKHSIIIDNKTLFNFLYTPSPVIEKIPKSNIDPATVRGLYVNSATLNSSKIEKLIDLAKKTEVNALVIDIKDDNGNTYINEKIAELIRRLHKENIYVIARIVVFKDNIFSQQHPEAALKNKKGTLWLDNLKSAWLDPASPLVQQNILEVSKKIIDLDFDELNYDYIRFATDKGSGDIMYPVWDGKTPKYEVMSNFFEFLNKELKKYNSEIKLSIDIFGYTFLRDSDLNIGQRLQDAIKFFDFVCPMVYPSHYAVGNFNFKNPAEHPYEVITETLKAGKEISKVRPWLQVFDLGAKYTASMVKKEKQAVYDFGLNGWLMWDPNNNYIEAALDK